MLPLGTGLRFVGSKVRIPRAAKKHLKNHLSGLMPFSESFVSKLEQRNVDAIPARPDPKCQSDRSSLAISAKRIDAVVAAGLATCRKNVRQRPSAIHIGSG